MEAAMIRSKFNEPESSGPTFRRKARIDSDPTLVRMERRRREPQSVPLGETRLSGGDPRREIKAQEPWSTLVFSLNLGPKGLGSSASAADRKVH